MSAYADSSEVVTCTCPARARPERGAVWGTDTYTADSATCRAALHAGMVGRQGGTVTIEMLPGSERYPGTTRNGVSSSNFGSYERQLPLPGRGKGRSQANAAGGGPELNARTT